MPTKTPALGLLFIVALAGCTFETESHEPRPASGPAPATQASCDSAPSPQIVALEMPPTATLGQVDYDLTGHVRFTGCSVVTIKVRQYSPDAELRAAPELAPPQSGHALVLHFPASRRGHDAVYDVSVIDARGRESTALRETAVLP